MERAADNIRARERARMRSRPTEGSENNSAAGKRTASEARIPTPQAKTLRVRCKGVRALVTSSVRENTTVPGQGTPSAPQGARALLLPSVSENISVTTAAAQFLVECSKISSFVTQRDFVLRRSKRALLHRKDEAVVGRLTNSLVESARFRLSSTEGSINYRKHEAVAGRPRANLWSIVSGKAFL